MSQSTKRAQASLDSWFKPAHSQAASSGAPSSPQENSTSKAITSNFPHPSFTGLSGSFGSPTSATGRPSTALSYQSYTSSLSPPPTSPVETYVTPIPPSTSVVSSFSAGRIVRSSDDEDEDSDDSLEDLATLFQPNRSTDRPDGVPPATPTVPRTKKLTFHTSPMPILKKGNFDLKSLASHAEMDRKSEASAKRVKAMQEASQKKENVKSRGDTASEKLKHSSILQETAESKDVDVSKLTRAVLRTEATLVDERWYFFDTHSKPPKPQRKPFPTRSIPKEWQHDLKDAQMRKQTFVSGYAEDLVSLDGIALPDEIFLWMLDEISIESSEPLRDSYSNVVKQSSEQVGRLVVPALIRRMFEAVGATSATTATTDKIRQVQAISTAYERRDWSKLRSVIRLLGQVARSLEARNYAMTMLLRMCCDKMVMENVDIFDSVQESIKRLCKYVPDESWESSCQTICTTLFNIVDESTLRLRMVQCVPSTSSRSHDLRRRLAMAFYFKDLSYSTAHSHKIFDLEKFIDRLESHDFDTVAETDYRELAALTSLLDIALDDGRSLSVDLADSETSVLFDKSIDELASVLVGILNSIGNPGAAFVSRIEAKEVLELVSKRISGALRSKPKAKETVFDPKIHGKNMEGDLVEEKKFMSSYFFKPKAVVNG